MVYGCPQDHIPTRIYQDLASLPIKGELRYLTLPKVPQVFIPLILANQGNISGKLKYGIYFLDGRKFPTIELFLQWDRSNKIQSKWNCLGEKTIELFLSNFGAFY